MGPLRFDILTLFLRHAYFGNERGGRNTGSSEWWRGVNKLQQSVCCCSSPDSWASAESHKARLQVTAAAGCKGEQLLTTSAANSIIDRRSHRVPFWHTHSCAVLLQIIDRVNSLERSLCVFLSIILKWYCQIWKCFYLQQVWSYVFCSVCVLDENHYVKIFWKRHWCNNMDMIPHQLPIQQ